MGLISLCVLLLCWSSLTNANAPPEFTKFQYFACEDVPPESVAFTILARDPDGDPLTYSISGTDAGSFRVDASTGNVYVEQELDADSEEGPVMHLSATVSDSVNLPVRSLLLIYINDTNDNRPFFVGAPYEASVEENTAVGTTLFKVSATDGDPSPRFTYKIDDSDPSSGLNVFRIDNLGKVILNENLNYTTSSFYRIKINVSDNGRKCFDDKSFPLYNSAVAFITVIDVPDLDPKFIGSPYRAEVKENSPIGQSVTAVTALDEDKGINDVIFYSILDSTADGVFTIDNNGVISVNSEIDREKIGDTVDLTVKAKESQLNIHGAEATATAQVQVTIIDVNDNAPQFYKCEDSDCVPASSFTGEAMEHSLETVFINMTVKDADNNPRTELLLDGDGKDIFSAEPSVATSDSDVQLKVMNFEDLDYEKIQQITLKVIAVDLRDPTFRSTADVTITINDANDHSPVFANYTYYAKVPEHCPDGTTVAHITAEDPDTMDQGKITYSLLPESILQYFDVETTTGRVFVKNGALLDREIRSLYSVTLQARDSAGKPGSTVLEITVTDINDKPPVPNRPTYQEFLFEGENLKDVKIEATDGDDPDSPNSQLVFAIEPGPYSENFTIDPDTGDLTNNGPLDREDIDPALDGKITLTVNISDKGDPPLSSEVQVIINVQDVNDNKPEFEKPFYNFTVREGEKGASVGSVYAEDQDQTTDFNRISFSIASGVFGSFMITSEAKAPGYTGNLRVDPDIELDYESSLKKFSLQVKAADLKEEFSEVTVEVYVLDVNDERPEFRPIPPVSVKENSKETGAIGKFDAVDQDTNSSLVYELVSVKCRCSGEERECDWFYLEPNGEVKINPDATIDYESCKQAIVEAQVVDENTEKGESNSASPGKMEINIEDENDNTPEFMDSNSVFVLVSESASQDTSVAEVTATDRDSGEYAQIEFQVTKVQFISSEDGDNNPSDRMLFKAKTTVEKDTYVGIILSTEQIDTTLKGKFLVTVEATDTGGLSNTTELEMFIIDKTYNNELKFGLPLSEVQAKEEEIRRDLMACTQAVVYIVKIRDANAPARATDVTIMEAYFIYSNGTALTSFEVQKDLSVPDNYAIMQKYQLVYVGTVDPEEPGPNIALYALFGFVAGFIVVTTILTTSLLCTRRNYRRRLKAANAMKSTSNVMSENQTGGPVVPGTNLYTMEGANPVLNLNIDSAIALDLGEDSDVDKVSLSSLDHGYDMTLTEKDTKPIMKSREKDEDKDSGLQEYIEPLGAALAQRDQKIRSSNPLLGDTNPVFNTTDL